MRPARVLLFLLVLAAPQAYAMIAQLRGGFVPFRTAPGRIPLSWDMFAVRIERCEIVWAPPLPDGTYSLYQRGTRLEWQYVLNRVDDYRGLIHWTCDAFHRPFSARFVCFTPEGKVETGADECR